MKTTRERLVVKNQLTEELEPPVLDKKEDLTKIEEYEYEYSDDEVAYLLYTETV